MTSTHQRICLSQWAHVCKDAVWASLVAQMVKNLPAMRETWVWSLRWEVPLEEGMATHFSILAWRIPMDRGAQQAKSMVSQRGRYDWTTKHSTAHAVIQTQTYIFRFQSESICLMLTYDKVCCGELLEITVMNKMQWMFMCLFTFNYFSHLCSDSHIPGAVSSYHFEVGTIIILTRKRRGFPGWCSG